MSRPATAVSFMGPFRVDRGGLINPSSPGLFSTFSMRWRGRLIRARMASMPDRSNSWALDLSARIGRVPSTAGQAPDERARRRHEVLQVLRCLPELASPGLRLCLAADHAVMVEARTDFCVPISAVILVTKLAVFMMALSPYLDVLDEAGAGVSYGIAAT